MKKNKKLELYGVEMWPVPKSQNLEPLVTEMNIGSVESRGRAIGLHFVGIQSANLRSDKGYSKLRKSPSEIIL